MGVSYVLSPPPLHVHDMATVLLLSTSLIYTFFAWAIIIAYLPNVPNMLHVCILFV